MPKLTFEPSLVPKLLRRSNYRSNIDSVCRINHTKRVNELRHINFGKLHFNGAEVKISIELGGEVNNCCRSPQLGAEVTTVPK